MLFFYSAVAKSEDTTSQIHSGVFYILEGVMPFLEVLPIKHYFTYTILKLVCVWIVIIIKVSDILALNWITYYDIRKSISVLEIFESGLYFLLFFQVFYTSFFSPDKDLYPDEIFLTDTLATTLTVCCICFKGIFIISPYSGVRRWFYAVFSVRMNYNGKLESLSSLNS